MRSARAVSGLIVSLLVCLPARADEVKADGRFIPVPPILSGEAVERLLDTLNEEIDRFTKLNNQLALDERRDFKVIFDFNPDGSPASSDRFEYCRLLADGIHALRGKPRVQTYAFVHGEVSRHTVLPVLACQKIVMSSKALLGPVVREGDKDLPEDIKLSYRRLGTTLASPDVMEKLFRRELEIVQSKTNGWVDREKRDEVAPGKPVVLFEANKPAQFTFKKAKDVRLCEPDPREDRREIVETYNLLETSLRENPLLRGVVAARIPVSGEINSSLKERLERRIWRATSKNANLIILELKCRKGDPAVANSIGEYLANYAQERKSGNPVEFVAYYTPEAEDTALYIALGCNSIVIDPKATLGNFGTLLKGKREAEIRAVADGIERLAEKRYYSKVLARAFVERPADPLFQVTSVKGAREKAYFTGRQLDTERRDRPGHWDTPVAVPLSDGLVTLNADDAVNFGIAYRKGNLDSIRTAKGIKPSDDLLYLGDDWLDDVADFLRQEWVRIMLVMIGVACMMLELKMPGVGIPGIIAALCFVLFFWANAKQMQGEDAPLIWLAVLLFLLGLILLGLEIFVLPGFGICGISGIILILGSLALASYGKWPQTGEEWVGLSKKTAPFGLSLIGAVVIVIVLARYLPSIPYVNRLLLKPPHGDEAHDGESDEGPRSAFAALLGAIGVAATPLRPAGKVQFGEQFVDVVAEGSYVAPGTRVQVIEIEGNRVVVKAV